jgi:Conserved protein implicated in secretion
MNVLKKSTSLKEKIITTLDLLKRYHSKLLNLKNKLKFREKDLFEKTVLAKQTGKDELALVFANEISQIRKLQNNLEFLLIHIEQLILRLETTIQLGEFLNLVTNSKQLISTVQKDVRSISPELANVLDDLYKDFEIVNSSYYPKNEFNFAVTSDEVEQIINEASEVASKRIKNIGENIGTLREKVPSKYLEELEAEEYGDIGLSKSNKFDKNFEDKLLRYIIENQGKINLKECAEKLGMAQDDIKEALINLSKQGKIQFKND